MNFHVATINEYQLLTEKLARVTATLSHPNMGREQAFRALQDACPQGTTPVRGSFTWIDEDSPAKQYVLGYVYAAGPVLPIEENKVPNNFRRVNANLFMDETDEAVWEMKKGAGGAYLARNGHVDLAGVLETAAVSPKGSTPRMHKIAASAVDTHEAVTFVVEGSHSAEVDSGFSLSRMENGSFMVFSNLEQKPVAVTIDRVISSFEIVKEALPTIPREEFKKVIASRSKQTAADAMTPKLTPQEYWNLAYSYAPDYVAKILKQVDEMAAA